MVGLHMCSFLHRNIEMDGCRRIYRAKQCISGPLCPSEVIKGKLPVLDDGKPEETVQQNEVIVKMFMRGDSVAEIAMACGVSKQNIYMRITRLGLRKLREEARDQMQTV